MSDISSYLTKTIADYESEILTLEPDQMMITTGKMNQILYEFDDGSLDVVTLSGSIFEIDIQWTWLSYSDAEILIDLYHNTNKANGMENTFYLQDPVNDNRYIVRFMTPLVSQYQADKFACESFPPIKLRIEGVYGGLYS